MKSISFAWTTPALLAGQKTVTRRDWKPRHAARFAAGEIVAAYDRQPMYGGKKVAEIRLTRAPYLESTANLDDTDWAAEGFEYLQPLGARIDGLTPQQLFAAWRLRPRALWVVRFRLETICD